MAPSKQGSLSDPLTPQQPACPSPLACCLAFARHSTARSTRDIMVDLAHDSRGSAAAAPGAGQQGSAEGPSAGEGAVQGQEQPCTTLIDVLSVPGIAQLLYAKLKWESAASREAVKSMRLASSSARIAIDGQVRNLLLSTLMTLRMLHGALLWTWSAEVKGGASSKRAAAAHAPCCPCLSCPIAAGDQADSFWLGHAARHVPSLDGCQDSEG